MQTKKFHLLVVDDDDLVHSSIELALPSQWQLTAISDFSNLPKRSFHAALVDMHLTGSLESCEGVGVIKELATQDIHLEIVAMSGHLDRETMEACLKAGASRFIAKPLTLDELKLTLEKIEALILMREAQSRSTGNQPVWIGASEASNNIRKTIASFRSEGGPILIEGPSGVGKEVAAQIIHMQEGQGRPFISVNVAAIPENLFESEFFGHIKGAFTGADSNKIGLLEAAHGGDLFLDEIEALPMNLQAKLLRFLESGEVRRVGDKKNIHVQTRVIAATNRSLQQMVEENEFREDLMWRLLGKRLLIPALCERNADIPDLLNHFLKHHRPKRQKLFETEAVETLKNHSWPGNVRELKRVCEQILIGSPLPFIRKQDVEIFLPEKKAKLSDSPLSVDLERGLADLTNEFEASIIRKSLEKTPDIDAAARLLKISRSNLYKKIKDYQIEL